MNAGYFRAGTGRVVSETRQYVAKVLDAYEGLKKRFERGSYDPGSPIVPIRDERKKAQLISQ